MTVIYFHYRNAFRLVNLLGAIGLFFSTLVLLRLLVQILRDRD